MTIPSRLNVELNEADVRSDIVKIIDSMSKIRLETLKNAKLPDEQKDEYLHLTYRLSSGIAGLSDKALIERMEFVIKSVDEDSRLLHYDYLQDNYWKRNNQEFSRTLDKVVISVLGDNLHTLEDKHHVFNALKFLGVTESPFEEKERIYGTILPFNGRVKDHKKRNKLSGLIGKIFGHSYRIEEDTEFNIRFSHIDPEFLEDVIREVQDYGYKTLETVMTKADFDRLKITNAQIIDKADESISYDSRREIVRKIIRSTLPLSYPLLGSLPGSLQNRIAEYTNIEGKKGFDVHTGCGTSCIIEMTSGVAAFSVGLAYKNYIMLGCSVYAMIESVVRVLNSYPEHGKYVGSLPVTLLAYSIKGSTNNSDKENKVKVQIQLDEREKKDDNANVFNYLNDKGQNDNTNMFNYFADIAENTTVPEDIEDNLVWSTQNHHSYGKHFSLYLYKTAQDLSQRQDCQQIIDKKNQFYNLFNTRQIGDYTKLTALAFSKGERYVLSLISAQQMQDPVLVANEILANNKQTSEKAKELTERLNAEYVHLSRFVNGNIADDLEIVS